MPAKGTCCDSWCCGPDQEPWIKLQADRFEATVSARNVLAHSGRLASLVAVQLSPSLCKTLRDHQPVVRLDCDAEVAKEVVAVLRYGRSYSPPRENPRLLKALQHQLELLGIPLPSGQLQQSRDGQEVVVLPSYLYDPSDYPDAFAVGGLLLYTNKLGGWANRRNGRDPRPPCVRGLPDSLDADLAGSRWLAAILRPEITGTDHDLVYMVPNDKPALYEQTAVVLHSTMSSSRFTTPPEHYNFVFRNSAMAAAKGKLYLLGGEPQHGASYTPLEVYDPHLDGWFKAAAPPGYTRQVLAHHALVNDQQESFLLALGGQSVARGRHNEQVLMYDVTSSKWYPAPGNCKWPGAAAAATVSAVAFDPHTIVVLSNGEDGSTGRTDLLDLRTWQWRLGAALQQPVHQAGTVMYEGQVMIIGGKDGDNSAGRSVFAYDCRTDSWSEKPPLPCGVWGASPVVVRVPSALQWMGNPSLSD